MVVKATKLQKLKEQRGFTWRWLSRKTEEVDLPSHKGISEKFICDIAKRDANPSVATLTLIAKALGVKASDILEDL